jgi:hypothetical protein
MGALDLPDATGLARPVRLGVAVVTTSARSRLPGVPGQGQPQEGRQG